MSQSLVVALLRRINSALPTDSRQMPEELSELSFAQVYLLSELFGLVRSGNKPPSLSALAQETGFSKATACAALKQLRKCGYVQMRMDDADNRRKEIMLTSQAWQVEPRVIQFVSALDRALCAGIPQDDLETTGRSLQAILQNAREVKAQVF